MSAGAVGCPELHDPCGVAWMAVLGREDGQTSPFDTGGIDDVRSGARMPRRPQVVPLTQDIGGVPRSHEVHGRLGATGVVERRAAALVERES